MVISTKVTTALAEPIVVDRFWRNPRSEPGGPLAAILDLVAGEAAMTAATAAVRVDVQFVDPLVAFSARCEARAILVAAGELTLHEAVDGLQEVAELDGLIDRLGQDRIQEIMGAAFDPGVDYVEGDLDDHGDLDDQGEVCCETCGTAPCTNPSFCAACRRTDRRLRRQREQAKTQHEKPRPVLAQSTIDAFKYLLREGDAKKVRDWLARRAPDEIEALTQMVTP